MKALVVAMPMKDCLEAPEVLRAAVPALGKGLGPWWRIGKVAMADGGEGTLAAFLDQPGYSPEKIPVKDALGRETEATLAWNAKERRAVIEMAQAAGLWKLTPQERDPLKTGTFGVGQMMLHAQALGAKEVLVGMGGSATVDGGLGMARCLGYHLEEVSGKSSAFPTGKTLTQLKTIRPPDRRPLSGMKVKGLYDVASPLLGPHGAAQMFGPQKGATPNMVANLEQGMAHLVQLTSGDGDQPGAGAAGGLGYGLSVFAQAKLTPGARTIGALLGLEKMIAETSIVLGLEGSLDAQTAQGKGLAEVARLCKKHSVPFIAIGGKLGQGYEVLYKSGLLAAFSLQEGPMSVAESIAQASDLISHRVEALGRMVGRLARNL